MTAYLITVAIIGIVIILIAAKLRITAQIVQFSNYQNPRGLAPMHAISKHVWQIENDMAAEVFDAFMIDAAGVE
jgi:hypothetical protein